MSGSESTGMTTTSSSMTIQPSSGWRALDVSEVWRFRELLLFLVWRDVKVRYKQAALGVLWVVLRPLMTVLVFSVVFGRLARIPSDGLPYPVFVLAAMVPWNLFSGALTAGTTSLVGSAHLITKVYFPRVVIPLAAVAATLVDIVINFLLVLALMAWYGKTPPASAAATIPALFVLALVISVGVGLWLGALNVTYRDVGNAVPFLVQVWMYATPIVYPLSLVPERWRWVASLNPMAGVTEGFRSGLFGLRWDLGSLGFSALFGILVLVSGLFYFRRAERTFADTV